MKKFQQILFYYKSIKGYGLNRLRSESFSKSLYHLVEHCLEYLQDCDRISLISKVEKKEYFSFQKGEKSSRAIRKDLFLSDFKLVSQFLDCLNEGDFSSIKNPQIDKASYTVAIGFCAVIDIEKSGDQKTPGTFFEYFIGHCFARRIGVNPIKRVDVLNLDMSTTLPTDFIFDLGKGEPKYHVPVKTSTRERVIQVWAHQRVLDGVYGTNRFTGILTCLSETKLDKKKREVVEICLPQQWRLYQMYISQMNRVYYLDLPSPYASLNQAFPKIQVKTFADFIRESEDFSVLHA